MADYILNEHNKEEFPPAHTAEHLLNQTMIRTLERLPDDASETIRLVRIGDYDVCPCIGKHVRSTSQIGRFELLGTNWDEQEHSFRVRFKIV